ncbi:hypothetical protein M422DRAFT_50908 [Sphaerobolus stellatus SS14]|uniref:Uncharacterized protein n=1 Tax=Sphaerobolus stellatus (strain SS14) TaxID=990650 RepID=A0A0C9UPU7_SPHS4|nr:hypothetical protein M422DRAFT_50908 [Sphaerobolus stellatus SS14]
MTGMDSMMSPSPTKKKPPSRLPPQRQGKINIFAAAKQEDSRPESVNEDEEEEEGEGEDDSDVGEPTIVVSKLTAPRREEPVSPVSVELPPSLPPSRPASQLSQPKLRTPVQSGKQTESSIPPSTSKTKVRRPRITPEMERVCVKIWSSLADLLVPGNNFSETGKQPNAKDTIIVLQTIAAQPIPDPTSTTEVSSPSTRSTLSSILGIEILGPAANTPQQTLTAEVLLALLTTQNFSMPLVALKARLTAKETGSSGSKQSAAAMGAGTRALYSCVAKKLVQIDRGGGTQVVKLETS